MVAQRSYQPLQMPNCKDYTLSFSTILCAIVLFFHYFTASMAPVRSFEGYLYIHWTSGDSIFSQCIYLMCAKLLKFSQVRWIGGSENSQGMLQILMWINVHALTGTFYVKHGLIYNPTSEKVWTVWKTQNDTGRSDV